GALVAYAESGAGGGELLRQERRAVVRHDPLDLHLLLNEPLDGTVQEGAGGLALLVRQDVDVREAGVVVGGHVDELKPLFLPPERALARDAMADPIEASQA